MRKEVDDLARSMRDRRPAVLIVEDNHDDVFLLQHVLADQGCDVLVKTDGGEAIELFAHCAHEPFDIIFLDLKLPSKNGVQVLQAAHTAMPFTPCVVITGYPESSMVQEAARLGFVELAAKPLTEQTIIRIFNTHRIALPRP